MTHGTKGGFLPPQSASQLLCLQAAACQCRRGESAAEEPESAAQLTARHSWSGAGSRVLTIIKGLVCLLTEILLQP